LTDIQPRIIWRDTTRSTEVGNPARLYRTSIATIQWFHQRIPAHKIVAATRLARSSISRFS